MNGLDRYLNEYEVIETKNAEIDCSDFELYKKKKLEVGYVKGTDLCSYGTPIVIRTLEGDNHISVTDEIILMIGIKGEVYPITVEKFQKSYQVLEGNYQCEAVYHPTVENETTGESYSLVEYAKPCLAMGAVKVYAKQLTHGVKIFTKEDERDCMTGEVGDYLAIREDDAHDIYVIEERIFKITYEKVQ